MVGSGLEPMIRIIRQRRCCSKLAGYRLAHQRVGVGQKKTLSRVKMASKWQRGPSRKQRFKAKLGFAFVLIE